MTSSRHFRVTDGVRVRCSVSGGSVISCREPNSTMEDDTETLLVMLSSLLPESHQNLDHESLLEALLECEGSVEAAAAKLTSQPSSSSVAGSSRSSTKKKRKRHVGLDDWLQKHPSTPKPPSKRINSGEGGTRTRSMSVPADDHRHPSPSSSSLKVKGSGKPNSGGNALAKLKPPSASAIPEVPAQLPPLTLGTPELVAKHTACTLHPQVLPPELAINLFETMLNEAETWDRNRFWLFERAAVSPHKNSFYVRDMSTVAGYGGKDDVTDLEWKEAAHYWYAIAAASARSSSDGVCRTQFGDAYPNPFPGPMEEACRLLEDVVNVEMRKRKQFDLEWGGNRKWIANVAAANCYEGAKENVGFHSDGL